MTAGLSAFDGPIARDLAWAVRRVPRHLREDAMQEARLHYFLALAAHRPGGGASLKSYTKWRMNGAVLDFLRRQDVLTRDHRAEVADSDYAPVHIALGVTIPDEAPSPEALAAAGEAPRLIAFTGGRARQVLARVYGEGETLSEAANAIGISSSHAHIARSAGLVCIRRAIQRRAALPAAA